MIDSTLCPTLCELINSQLAVFPEHEDYLRKRFETASSLDLQFSEEIARLITTIADKGPGISTYCQDYHFLTEIVLEEELYFRRHGRYRLSTFDDALRLVYSNTEYMTRYMNGLLLTQLWWRNHTEILNWYRQKFLGRAKKGGSHLEIGPGHGLLLYLACNAADWGEIAAWDVSKSSIELTQHSMQALRYHGEVGYDLVDLFDAPSRKFDSITFAEVLEHLENPVEALEAIRDLLHSDGTLFLHAPVNSPAPDHISLFETPEQIVELVETSGFQVTSQLFSPTTTAKTLDRARKYRMAISVGLICKPKGI